MSDSLHLEPGVREIGRRRWKSDIDNAYFDACRSGAIERHKFLERNSVYRFLMAEHADWNDKFTQKLLTNPGLNWTLENQILDQLGPPRYRRGKKLGIRIVGVENRWTVFEHAAANMPGKCRVRHNFHVEGEDQKCVFSNRATLLFGDIEHLPFPTNSGLGIKLNKGLLGFNLGKSANKHFRNFTAIWWDTFSPLGRVGASRFLRNIPKLVNPLAEKVPFCATVLLARDNIPMASPGVDSRADAIKHEIESTGSHDCEIKKAWNYKGLNGSPMGTVCSVIRKRS